MHAGFLFVETAQAFNPASEVTSTADDFAANAGLFS